MSDLIWAFAGAAVFAAGAALVCDWFGIICAGLLGAAFGVAPLDLGFSRTRVAIATVGAVLALRWAVLAIGQL